MSARAPAATAELGSSRSTSRRDRRQVARPRTPSFVAALMLTTAAPALAANDAAAPPAGDAAPATPRPVPLLPSHGGEDEAVADDAPLDPFERIHDLEVRLEQTRSLALGQKPRVVVS